MTKVELTVGFLLWKRIRNLLLSMQHDGYSISHIEGSGLLWRPFFISGDAAAIKKFNDCVKQYEEAT